MMNLVYKLLALVELLIGVFGMAVGLLFILCVYYVGIEGLLCGILLIIFGGLALQLGQRLIEDCVEREVVIETEKEH